MDAHGGKKSLSLLITINEWSATRLGLYFYGENMI